MSDNEKVSFNRSKGEIKHECKEKEKTGNFPEFSSDFPRCRMIRFLRKSNMTASLTADNQAVLASFSLSFATIKRKSQRKPEKF